MAMISYPMQQAKRDDCMLAIFPQHGGCCLNRISPDTVPFTADTAPQKEKYSNVWQFQQHGFLVKRHTAMFPMGFGCPYDIMENNSYWNENREGCVQSTVDVRGNTTSKTMIVKAWCRKSKNETEQQQGICLQNPLISAGTCWANISNETIFRFLVEEYHHNDISQRTLNIIAGFVFDEANDDTSLKNEKLSILLPEKYMDKLTVYALVADYDKTPGEMEIRIYADGEMLGSKTCQAMRWSVMDKYPGMYYVAVRREASTSMSTWGFVSWGLMFDSVLTDEEIKSYK